MPARVIAFANQKGGVGKTTTCVNLAAGLFAAKQRVLLIDLDPQGNATMGAGVDKNKIQLSMNEVLLDEALVTQAIIRNTQGGFDVLPANGDLTEAEVSLVKRQQEPKKLKKILERISERYDYILIDCPPSLNMLTLNALVAADSVLVPMQCEYYALEGLSALMQTVSQIRKSVNPHIEIEGILRTMVDTRSRLSQEVSEELQLVFGEKLFKTYIPRNVKLAEAPSHGLPGLTYDPQARGSLAYLELASELINRQKLRLKAPLTSEASALTTSDEEL